MLDNRVSGYDTDRVASAGCGRPQHRHGITAISDTKFFIESVTYIVGGLRSWGWVMLIIGVIELSGSNLSDLDACSESLAERSITAFSGR